MSYDKANQEKEILNHLNTMISEMLLDKNHIIQKYHRKINSKIKNKGDIRANLVMALMATIANDPLKEHTDLAVFEFYLKQLPVKHTHDFKDFGTNLH